MVRRNNNNKNNNNDMEDEESFSTGSLTVPVQASNLRKGSYAMFRETHPCKISEMHQTKEGKHGPAKVHMTGIDIFTDKKVEDANPSKSVVYCPIVLKEENWQLVELQEDGSVRLLNPQGREKVSLRINDEDMREELEDLLMKKPDAEIICSVIAALDKIRVLSFEVKKEDENDK